MSPLTRKIVGTWLLIGCIMIFFQVILGGVTRLTESGLSITEWKPVKGILPPLNTDEWNQEFSRYKEKVQYQVINEGMALHEFKWIFFWEYFHRLWARLLGVAFIIPFIYFLWKGYIDKHLGIHLTALFIIGALQGFVGWIMVRAGLSGIFVPPLRLSVHLTLALMLYAYLVWLTLRVYRAPAHFGKVTSGIKTLAFAILAVLFLQIFLGGILSGMKAGLAYPSWPDMNHEFIPSALSTQAATTAGFLKYIPQDLWGKAFIQFVHRLTAYTLVVLIIVFFVRTRSIATDKIFQTGLRWFPFFVLLQATIGILTVVNCIGRIPISWGAIHQAGAMFLIAETVFVIFHLTSNTDPTHE